MYVVEMSPEEQEQAIEKARQVGAAFAEMGPKYDEANTFAYDSIAIMKESGLVGLTIPKEYGGLGGDIYTVSRVITELAKGDAGIALGYNMHYIVSGFQVQLLSDTQKKHWLSRIAESDLIAGIYSEERAGFSGLADTKAVPQPGGGWKLYGKKNWATLSEAADILNTNATITDAEGNLPEDFDERVSQESVFILDMKSPGIEIVPTWDAMGMRASGTHTLILDGVYVPEDGYVNQWRGGVFSVLEWASLSFASIYYGLALHAYEEAKAIIRKKSLGAVFGANVGADVKVANLGYIKDGLGEMLVKNELTRRVIQSTCLEVIEGADDRWTADARPAQIGLAKVFATENAIDVCRQAMRLVGGMSFRRGHPLEKLYRDAAAGPFQPLTSDQTYSYLGEAELAPDDFDF